MKWPQLTLSLLSTLAFQTMGLAVAAHGQPTDSKSGTIRGGSLSILASDDGFYALRSAMIPGDVLRSEVEADTASGTLRSSLYPRHLKTITPFQDELGAGHLLTVAHTGLPGKPDLVCEFRVFDNQPWGDILVTVRNATAEPVDVLSIRVVKSASGPVVQLKGPASSDRILSDGYEETTPPMRQMDLAENHGIHQGYGSQLIYNGQSGMSLFMGALSADRFVTVLHIEGSETPDSRLLSYDVTDTGTTGALERNAQYTTGNPDPLRLRATAGESVSSERLMFAIGSDYHAQLENYGAAVRILHKPHLDLAAPMGWWSWTAYYYHVTEGTMLTNAAWLNQNLTSL